jgi:hypothetical protein
MEEFAETFTEDGTLTISGATLALRDVGGFLESHDEAMPDRGVTSRGRAGILESQAPFLATATASKHFPGPSVVSISGDTAEAETDFIYVHRKEDNSVEVLTAGRYNDSLVRESGRWRIKRREVTRLNDGTVNAGIYTRRNYEQ